jgi:hypothetical protein
MANEKLEAQYRGIVDRQKNKASEVTGQPWQEKPIAGEPITDADLSERRAKGNPSPLDHVGIADIYLLLWKVFIASALFAIPFVLIYILIESRH